MKLALSVSLMKQLAIPLSCKKRSKRLVISPALIKPLAIRLSQQAGKSLVISRKRARGFS